MAVEEEDEVVEDEVTEDDADGICATSMSGLSIPSGSSAKCCKLEIELDPVVGRLKEAERSAGAEAEEEAGIVGIECCRVTGSVARLLVAVSGID